MPWTRKGREWKNGSGNLDTDDIRCILIALSALTAARAITGASAATPGVITCAGHGRSTGDEVFIVGVGGVAAANGYFTVTVIDANSFSIQDPYTGANVTTTGTYTSGGYMIPLHGTALDNLNDVPGGARAATSSTLANTSITDGIFDADDVVFPSVPAGAAIGAFLLYYHTGTESTSVLLFWGGSSNLPLTPDGNNINLTWAGAPNYISRELG